MSSLALAKEPPPPRGLEIWLYFRLKVGRDLDARMNITYHVAPAFFVSNGGSILNQTILEAIRRGLLGLKGPLATRTSPFYQIKIVNSDEFTDQWATTAFASIGSHTCILIPSAQRS